MGRLSFFDCGLYPEIADGEMTGWCRERVNVAIWKTLPEA